MSHAVIDRVEISPREFDQLRDYIRDLCGLEVALDKQYLIECRLHRVLRFAHCGSFAEFYHRLIEQQDDVLVELLIDAITTNETSWFRDRHPFQALLNVLLPQAAKRRSTGPVRIWSCGCSTGQEPYSIAITVDRWLNSKTDERLSRDEIEILATDISPATLFLASTGRYDRLAVDRGLDNATLRRYFERIGSTYLIDEKIKNMVQFKRLNLLEPTEQLGVFDVIFYRNVSIYFGAKVRREAHRRVHSHLKQGGVMILGAAEDLYGLEPEMKRMRYKGTIYYNKVTEG